MLHKYVMSNKSLAFYQRNALVYYLPFSVLLSHKQHICDNLLYMKGVGSVKRDLHRKIYLKLRERYNVGFRKTRAVLIATCLPLFCLKFGMSARIVH